MGFEDKGMGRLPAPDPRDAEFLVPRLLSIAIATPALIRDGSRWYKTGPTLDQGPLPQCVGYSWRQWLSSALLMSKGGPSAPVIYDGAQRMDEWPGEGYDGSSVRGGAKFLQSLGHISNYFWSLDAEGVKQFILAGLGGVVFGTWWYESMFSPDKNGYLKVDGQTVGGHAYLCIGYSKPRNAFRFINSWGPGFGQGGRFWMSYADVDRLIKEEGEACCATEVKLNV